MKVHAAFDPGSRKSAIAFVDERGIPITAEPIAADGQVNMIKLLGNVIGENLLHFDVDGPRIMSYTVEDQTQRGPNSKVPPQTLIPYSHVAGAAFQAFASSHICQYADGRFVDAMTWKGSFSKAIIHRRLCKAVGWQWREQEMSDHTRIIPALEDDTSWNTISDASWPDVLDALGIARWRASQGN